MRPLFKEKISRFGALVSLVALALLTALFASALPETLLSVPGRIFAAMWVLTAGLLFAAYLGRFTGGVRRYQAGWPTERVQKAKPVREQRRLARG